MKNIILVGGATGGGKEKFANLIKDRFAQNADIVTTHDMHWNLAQAGSLSKQESALMQEEPYDAGQFAKDGVKGNQRIIDGLNAQSDIVIRKGLMPYLNGKNESKGNLNVIVQGIQLVPAIVNSEIIIPNSDNVDVNIVPLIVTTGDQELYLQQIKELGGTELEHRLGVFNNLLVIQDYLKNEVAKLKKFVHLENNRDENKNLRSIESLASLLK